MFEKVICCYFVAVFRFVEFDDVCCIIMFSWCGVFENIHLC